MALMLLMQVGAAADICGWLIALDEKQNTPAHPRRELYA